MTTETLFISSSNTKALLKDLKATDIPLPNRSEGRTKEHLEKYAIAHLLSCLATGPSLKYPVTLYKRERPDFRLLLNKSNIGIEVTEATPTNHAHESVLRDRNEGPDVYFMQKHTIGERKKSKSELLKEIKSDNPGEGWVGNSAEKQWAEVVLQFTLKKIDLAKKEGYQLYGKNWLLIYEDWPLPAPNVRLASQLFLDMINNTDRFNVFDKIFVYSRNVICEFQKLKFKLHAINDLWV